MLFALRFFRNQTALLSELQQNILYASGEKSIGCS